MNKKFEELKESLLPMNLPDIDFDTVEIDGLRDYKKCILTIKNNIEINFERVLDLKDYDILLNREIYTLLNMYLDSYDRLMYLEKIVDEMIKIKEDNWFDRQMKMLEND